MKKEMLINVLQPEECRIAIVEDGQLEELYVERASQETYVGNIYKGRIVNIEPSIQAAFVDFGIGRNGFLHVSDVDPVYYKHLLPKDVRDAMDAEDEGRAPRNRAGRDHDRGRPERRNDAPRDDRGPRVARPETVTTVPPAEFADDDGFGDGLADEPAMAAPAHPLDPIPEAPPATPVQRRPEEPPPRPAPVAPPAPPADLSDDDGDGFGVGLDLDAEPTDAGASARVTVKEVIEEAFGEAEPAAEAEKPAKPRARRTRKKEPAEGDEPTAEGDEKPAKPRARRTKKKPADDAAGSDPAAPDAGDEPRVMGGAERRTHPDDEPEVQPFFGGASDDFDPDAPNDRFGEGEADAGDPPIPAESEAEAVTLLDSDEEPELAPQRPRRDDRGRGRDRDRGRGRDRGRRDDRPPADEPEPAFAPAGGGFDDEDEEAGFGGPPSRDRGRPRNGGPRRGGPSRGGPPSRDRGYPRPPIQEIFKRGQEVIVQVIKEGIGTKGPTLSTFISIAGRYLVLMPSLNRVGVSRKIEDPDARRRLRDIMNGLNPPKGVGFIVRTAAIEQNEEDLQNDLQYLLRLWQVVVRRLKKVQGAVEVYRESDIITRTIRDILSPDIDTIWVDEANSYASASDFLQVVMPRFASRIRHYDATEPLFHKYGIEHEIAKLNHKRLDLPQGGSIIIEQTEALVAIDVNSGTFRAENRDAEETAFRMNMLAAKEIARQLRLRDLGGVIVNDFIDMRGEAHRRQVEDTLRDALKRDRARTKILRISQFGIIEMTRQRLQPSLKKRVYNDCPHCAGSGYVKSNETMGIEAMRLLHLAAHRAPAVAAAVVTVHTEVAFYLLNRKRKEIAAMEERAGIEVQVNGVPGVSPDFCEFKCFDPNGGEVRLLAGPPPRMFRGPAPRSGPERRFPQPLD
jgi:ribonuclease E